MKMQRSVNRSLSPASQCKFREKSARALEMRTFLEAMGMHIRLRGTQKPVRQAAYPKDQRETPAPSAPSQDRCSLLHGAPRWIASPQRGAVWGGSIMKIRRRTFLQLAAGAVAMPAVPRMARAQAYPSRPVRIIVAFPAGGATDIQARLMGQWLSDRLGQQFIIENRAGASGNIGTEAVAKAPADGYTLLQIVTPHAINAALYSNLNFDFIRDIAPVICAARLAYVVVVHPSVPATTIPEFIAYAKANPGKINYGSAGPGTPQNIACE